MSCKIGSRLSKLTETKLRNFITPLRSHTNRFQVLVAFSFTQRTSECSLAPLYSELYNRDGDMIVEYFEFFFSFAVNDLVLKFLLCSLFDGKTGHLVDSRILIFFISL